MEHKCWHRRLISLEIAIIYQEWTQKKRCHLAFLAWNISNLRLNLSQKTLISQWTFRKFKFQVTRKYCVWIRNISALRKEPPDCKSSQFFLSPVFISPAQTTTHLKDIKQDEQSYSSNSKKDGWMKFYNLEYYFSLDSLLSIGLYQLTL
jgi:hypothetical protein